MKLVTVYQTPLYLQHKHHLFSLASSTVFVLNVLVCVIPLLICWKGNFNEPEFSDIEQPRVIFNYRYLFAATLTDENGTESDVTCSSFDHYNRLTDQYQLCSSFKFSHQDFDHDDVDDFMNFEISFDRPAAASLTSLSLYLELQVTLEKICDFTVPGAVVLYQLAPPTFPAQNIHLVGDLKLKQANTLHCPYFMFDQKSHFRQTIINQNSSRLADYDLPKAYSKLITNPAHFQFDEEFRTSNNDGHFDEFTLRFDLNLPEVVVRYRKTFWRLLFEFWIQYLAVFVVFFVLADNFKRFLFKNSYFLTWKQMEDK